MSSDARDDPEFWKQYVRTLDRWRDVGWAALTTRERRLVAISTLLNEVSNGGLLQYFDNDYCEHADMALAGLRSLGTGEAAGILEEAAVLVFGTAEVPPRHSDRAAAFHRLPDGAWQGLEVLTRSFYSHAPAVWQSLADDARSGPLDAEE